jgi:hypothetical protein
MEMHRMAETDEQGALCLDHDPPVALMIGDTDNDNSRVRCPQCQRDFGTWGEFKAALSGAAAERLQSAFKGVQGFTPAKR